MGPSVLLALLVLGGCSVDTWAIDPGRGDGSSPDVGVTDSAGPRDGEPLDGEPPDTAGPLDSSSDTAPPDAPPADSGVVDTSMPSDFCDTTDPALRFCVRFEDALLDEASAAHPISGTGHDFGPGQVGRALEHGPGDSVWLSSTTDLATVPLTFELWLRPRALPSSGRVGVVDFDGAFGVFLYPGGDVGCKHAEEARSVGRAAVGRWTHVACVFETGEVRIYVDGTEAGSSFSSYAGGSGGGDFRFGGNAPSGDDYEGAIDEARYFADVRSDAEIAAAAAR